MDPDNAPNGRVDLGLDNFLPSDMSDRQQHYDDAQGSEGGARHPIAISSRAPSTHYEEYGDQDEQDGYLEPEVDAQEHFHQAEERFEPFVDDQAFAEDIHDHPDGMQHGDGQEMDEDETERQLESQFQDQAFHREEYDTNQPPNQYDQQNLFPHADQPAEEAALPEQKPRKKGKKGKKKKQQDVPYDNEPPRTDQAQWQRFPPPTSGLFDRGPQRLNTTAFRPATDMSRLPLGPDIGTTERPGYLFQRPAMPMSFGRTPQQIQTPAASFQPPRSPPPSHARAASITRAAPKGTRGRSASRSVRARSATREKIPQAKEDHTLSDAIESMVQDFRRAAKRQQQEVVDGLQLENRKLQNDLQQAQNVHQTLQTQIDILQREKTNIADALQQQKQKSARLTSVEAKAGKLKVFVDGLGNDINNLKRDAQEYRLKCERIATEADTNHEINKSLLEQLSGYSEKATQLKDQALKACQDASFELSTATTRCAHLEEQLSNSSNLLAEEKDSRSQLQSQLSSANSAKESIVNELKSGNNDVLTKLGELHSSMAQHGVQGEIRELVGNTFAQVEGVATQQTSTDGTISSLKGLIEALSERVPNAEDEHAQSDEIASLKTYLDQALSSLKDDLCQYEKLTAEGATNCETIASLQEKLNTRDSQISELNTRLSDTSVSDVLEAQLREARIELQTKSTTLESLQAELAGKIQELEKLASDNKALQHGIEESDPSTVLSDQQLEAARAEGRNEVAENVRQLREQIEADSANKLKSTQSERDRAFGRMKKLETQLAAANEKLEGAEGNETQVLQIQEELAAAKGLAHKRKEEIEKLQQELAQAAERGRTGRESETDLTAQIEAERNTTQYLRNRLRAAERAKTEAETAMATADTEANDRSNRNKVEAETELLEVRKQSNTRIKDLQAQLTEREKELRERDEAIREKEKTIGEKDNQVQEKERALQEKAAEKAEFQSSVESSWANEQQQHQEQVAHLKAKIVEAESKRDEAVAKSLRVKDEVSASEQQKYQGKLAHMKAKIVEAESKRDEAVADSSRLQKGLTKATARKDTAQQAKTSRSIQNNIGISSQLSDNRAHGSTGSRSQSSGVVVAGAGNGTIAASSTVRPSQQLTKARKAVSRESQPLVPQSGSVLPSGVSHLSSSRVEPPVKSARVSVVEETQQIYPFEFDESDNDNKAAEPSSHAAKKVRGAVVEESQQPAYNPPKASYGRVRDDNAFNTATQQMHENDGAQFEHPLVDQEPPFAVFYSKRSQQSQQAHQPAEPCSNDSLLSAANPYSQESTAIKARGNSQVGVRDTQDAYMQLQSQLDSYKKPTAVPNSSSKLIRAASNTSHRSGGHSHPSKFQTPDPRGFSDEVAPPDQSQPHGSSSSTPQYVRAAQNRPKNTYGHSSGSAKERSVSRRESGLGQKQTQPTPTAIKRKASGQIVEGYEQERKKRVNAAIMSKAETQPDIMAPPSSQGSMLQPRSFSQPQGPATAARKAQPASRTQTLAGASTRQTRSSNPRRSKNDEMSSRFRQELNRR